MYARVHEELPRTNNAVGGLQPTWVPVIPTFGATYRHTQERAKAPWAFVTLGFGLTWILSPWAFVPLGFCPPGVLSSWDFVLEPHSQGSDPAPHPPPRPKPVGVHI